jgi:hypothetical protein
MKRKILLAALFFFTPALALASDVKYTQQMNIPGMPGMASMTTTVYIKGEQERRDTNVMSREMSTITLCPKKQIITVNHKCKLYFIAPIEEGGAPAMPMPAAGPARMGPRQPTRQGGLVVIENDVRDTGERQEMSGLPVRHVLFNMSMDAKEGSCNPGHTEMSMDEWVVELPPFSCRMKLAEAPPPAMPEARGGGCRDKYQVTAKGNAASLSGFPVKMAIYSGGRWQTLPMEVIDISTAPLDQSVFEVPAGYREAASEQEVNSCGLGLGSMMQAMRQAQAQQPATRRQEPSAGEEAVPRGAGLPRIGVVSTENVSGPEASQLSDELVEDIKATQQFDAVRIDSTTPDDIQKEAAEKKCEFLLYNNVAEAGTKAPKLGGLFGRGIRGVLMPTLTIRSDYRLALVEPFDQEVAKDTLSQSEQAAGMDQVAAHLMKNMADRAVRDGARWNLEHH